MMSSDDAEVRLKTALADRYRIDREIGSGGMATVYLAQDLRHDRRVAVKVLRPELAASLGPDRFLQEIKIAAKLTHPHILPLHDSGEAEGFLYYVMPFIEGDSLRDRLEEKGQLSVEETVRILHDVVDALAEAHAHGVIHRDIKPENVMLRGQHALVADFGVAKAVSQAPGRQKLTTAGVALGTPAYMAPEQAEAEEDVDHRTDLYAVGVLGYEMLSGRSPFEASSFGALLAAKLEGRFEPLGEVREGLPGPLVGAIHKCLNREPADRWESAEEFQRELDLLSTPAAGVAAPLRTPGQRRRRAKRLGFAAAALAVAAILFFGGRWYLERERQMAWARDEGVPEVRRMRDSGELGGAFALALQLIDVLGDEPALDTILEPFTALGTIRSQPSGARAWWRPYGRDESDPEGFHYLGVTPVEALLPTTYFDVRIEHEGYEPRLEPSHQLRFGQFAEYFGGPVRLAPEGSVPAGMVYIPGGEIGLESPGLEGVEPVPLGPYYLGRLEATNREFKEFVDAGGYRNSDWWVHPFLERTDTLAWEAAVARFIDRTGRPGPSTWEAGDFPEGAEELPVGGISWYEAAAYAEFRGKALPTIFHWNRALDAVNTDALAPRSVFGSQRPMPVGASGARGRFGNYDMGGNVREWCLNENGGRGYILGGGWTDPVYMFNDAYTQSSWDRSEINGVRLADYGPGESNLAVAGRWIDRPFRDFRALQPASDEIYRVYQSFFAYDDVPLDPRVEAADTTEDWIRETISFDAGYDDERVLLHLYLPTSAPPPFQPVIKYPGSGAIFMGSIDDYPTSGWDFIMKTGRAVVLPAYWGTLERRAGLTTDQPDTTAAYRDRVLRWSRDFRRSIDWAETRPDLDVDHLGFYGVSWGGRLGPLMLALEPRIRAAVLNVGGLKFQASMPEVDPFHHASRVEIPVLMLNGELDHFFPLETSSKPLFELLGTPDNLKRHVVEEGGHFLRQDRVIAETLAWYDRFLGLVR